MSMIDVYIQQGVPYIWNAEDVIALRELRIVGSLVGSLPLKPKQNIHLGLPLQLMKEEAKLLAEKGLVNLRDDNIKLRAPTKMQIEEYEALRKKSHDEQVIFCREKKKEEMEKKLDTIKEGKRKKIVQNLPPDTAIDEKELDRQIQAEIDKIEFAPLPAKRAAVQIFTINPVKPMSDVPIEWKYPETEDEDLRYHVFKELWEKGYFLTSGVKFGGDFLVYPGDPARYHSFFIAICVPYKKPFSGLDFAAMGQLGTTVKKTILLCSQTEDNKVICTSLQWTGIS